jgi:Arc/MetJ family transcription regulator
MTAFGYAATVKPASKKKATFYLPEDLLRAARVRAARMDRRDSEVVEEALRAYLGWDVVESVWARSQLSEDEAMELAVSEVRAHRAEQRAARGS